MPTGNDEADLFITTVGGGSDQPSTQLPFISIAAEMWRGFRDLAAALESAAAVFPSHPRSAGTAHYYCPYYCTSYCPYYCTTYCTSYCYFLPTYCRCADLGEGTVKASPPPPRTATHLNAGKWA
jgi:hypothetical protein